MSSTRSNVLWQGMIAGLIGYATVAIVLAVVNVIAGRSPFYTAALLGGGVFYGVRDLSAVAVWPGAVLAYNGFHLLLFLALGMFAAWLAQIAERGPHLWYVGVTFFVLVAFHVFGMMFLLPPALRPVMLVWSALASGVLASALMALYLVMIHPMIREEMRDFAAHDPDLVDQPR